MTCCYGDFRGCAPIPQVTSGSSRIAHTKTPLRYTSSQPAFLSIGLLQIYVKRARNDVTLLQKRGVICSRNWYRPVPAIKIKNRINFFRIRTIPIIFRYFPANFHFPPLFRSTFLTDLRRAPQTETAFKRYLPSATFWRYIFLGLAFPSKIP